MGCEQFYEPGELVDGRCPEHLRPPEPVEEENWFFLLSRYEAPIRDALASGRLRIEPRERAREIEKLLAGGLRDISVSRSRARARGWGIPVPGDPDQVVWVWLDALANYLATLGYPSDVEKCRALWLLADRRVHVLGKGILRFHALVWPALLLATGLPLPTTLWVHGYLTVGGQKIGKSRGNAIDQGVVAGAYGVDALRYFLLRHVGPKQDSDVDDARIDAVYRADLADALGNLLSRTLALVRSALAGRVPPAPVAGLDPLGEALALRAARLASEVDEAVDCFAPDEALRAIWAIIAAGNKHLADTAPWALAKRAGSERQVEAILSHATFALGAVGRSLVPFLPDTARAILAALASPDRPAPVLFPKGPRAGLGPATPGS